MTKKSLCECNVYKLEYFGMWPFRNVPGCGARFNIKMSSYQDRKSHCGDKTVVRSSYLHNGISYTGKMSSLYWIRAVAVMGCGHFGDWPFMSVIMMYDNMVLSFINKFMIRLSLLNMKDVPYNLHVPSEGWLRKPSIYIYVAYILKSQNFSSCSRGLTMTVQI